MLKVVVHFGYVVLAVLIILVTGSFFKYLSTSYTNVPLRSAHQAPANRYSFCHWALLCFLHLNHTLLFKLQATLLFKLQATFLLKLQTT